MSTNRSILIIAGGAGTRLWPLSRAAQPKQFQRLPGPDTLLQHMVKLAQQVVPLEQIYIMTVENFSQTIQEQLPDLPAENILTEPARRDTGPAVTLAMLYMKQRNPHASIAFLWSDHLVQDAEQFKQCLLAAFTASEEYPQRLVMLGANPTKPETGFGYIQMGKEITQYNEIPIFEVKRFIEKPDLPTAVRFVNSWDYLWNMGYQVINVETFFTQLAAVQPELPPALAKLEEAVASKNHTALADAYEALPKLSLDYLYTQYLKDILVVPADMGWSDVGNWNILHEVLPQDEKQMVIQGEVQMVNSENCLVFAKDRPIALVGVKNLVIVDAGDTILVMDKNAAQDMKTLNTLLAETNPELL